MDKVIVDWADINDEYVAGRIINRRNFASKSSPSLFIKQKIINELLKSLSEEEKKLIILYFYEDLSLRQIAKKYNTTHTIILKRLKLIIEKMREVLYVKIDVL